MFFSRMTLVLAVCIPPAACGDGVAGDSEGEKETADGTEADTAEDSGGESDSETEEETRIDTDTGTDADTDADTDTDTDSDTDSDTGGDAEPTWTQYDLPALDETLTSEIVGVWELDDAGFLRRFAFDVDGSFVESRGAPEDGPLTNEAGTWSVEGGLLNLVYEDIGEGTGVAYSTIVIVGDILHFNQFRRAEGSGESLDGTWFSLEAGLVTGGDEEDSSITTEWTFHIAEGICDITRDFEWIVDGDYAYDIHETGVAPIREESAIIYWKPYEDWDECGDVIGYVDENGEFVEEEVCEEEEVFGYRPFEDVIIRDASNLQDIYERGYKRVGGDESDTDPDTEGDDRCCLCTCRVDSDAGDPPQEMLVPSDDNDCETECLNQCELEDMILEFQAEMGCL